MGVVAGGEQGRRSEAAGAENIEYRERGSLFPSTGWLAEVVKSCETPRDGAPVTCRLISERGIGVGTVSVSEVEGPGAGPQCPRNSGGSQRKVALGMSVQDPGPVASEWAQAAPPAPSLGYRGPVLGL